MARECRSWSFRHFVRENFVDRPVTDQSSILRFIEDNVALGRIQRGSFDALAGSLENMFDFGAGPRHEKVFLKCAMAR